MLCAGAVFAILLPDQAFNVAKESRDNGARIPPALRQYAQIGDLETPAALKLFKLGVDAYLGKRYAAALDVLPAEQDAKTTALADHILLYRSKASLMAERNEEALEGFRLLEKQFPESLLLQNALLGQCQALLKLKDAQSALSVLNDPRMKQNSEALYYRARALQIAEQKEKAVELYLQYHAGYPKGEFASSAQQNLLALAPSALKGKRSYAVRLQRAESLLRANDTRGARQSLVALGNVAAPDALSSQRRNLLLGEAEYRLGRTAAALIHLRKVNATDPAMHAKALRLEGSCYRRSDRIQALIALRDRALKLYSGSPEIEELCYTVATYFDVSCDDTKARQAYKILHDHFPKGKHAERAAWKLALYYYSGKEYGEAASGFWRYLQAYPNLSTSVAAMYWMGRSYAALGGSENARYLYRRVQELANDSYYGQCARQAEAELGKSGNTENVSVPGIVFDQVITTCDALRLPAVFLKEPGRTTLPLIERARQLWSAGLPDMAVSELRWAIGMFPQDEKPLSYIIARIYESNGDHYRTITSLRGVIPYYIHMPAAALPEEIWQLLFPSPHRNLVYDHSDKNRLDPALVMGLIRQESAFNETARSSANARGLMQILPATASRLARQARITRYNSKKLFQAETNILLGTRYLAALLKRYGGAETALAAYNAGGSRVDLWLKEFGNVDMPEFVERIPFSETRGYIKQVLSNKAVYGWLTSSAAQESR